MSLARQGARVIAVELDEQFAQVLSEVQARHPTIQVECVDLKHFAFSGVDAIVGNPPYGALQHIARLLVSNQLAFASLLVPRRFAKAAIASPGDPTFNRTSLMLQARHAASVIAVVPPTSFLPPPRTASALLRLTPEERSRSFKSLASWMSTLGKRRVRDFTAAQGWPRASSLPLRPQARLQSLTSDEVSLLAGLALEDNTE